MSGAPTTKRFREREIVLESGARGRVIEIPSASPVNFHQAISRPHEMERLTVDGQLFLPPAEKRRGAGPLPLVLVVPGSLGVTAANLAHASTLTGEGLAAFVLDSFGARGVTSTVAKQTQFSFAASAYDVLAASMVLAKLPEIDGRRIGTQGHSRGGAAVLSAAARRFADGIVGVGAGPVAVLGAYPWSGQQFLDARVGATEIRVLMGDRDEWCSAMQTQGHVQAIRMAGGRATMRIFGGAHHSFDRGSPVVDIAEASVAPHAPTAYIADDGAFVHPLSETPDPALVDRDLMVYAIKAGYGKKGARLGSNPGDADAFREEMVRFWTRVLGPAA